MGKQLHAGPIKTESGFFGSSFGFFHRVRGGNLISTMRQRIQVGTIYVAIHEVPTPSVARSAG